MELNRVKKICYWIFFVIIIDIFFIVLGLEKKNMDFLEYEDYKLSYQVNVQTVIDQANMYLKLSVFNKDGQFSKNNINKTLTDFQSIKNVKISQVNVESWDYYFNNDAARWCLLVIGIFITCFYAKKENYSLKQVIHTSIKGKGTRNLRIIGSITFLVLICNVIVYFVNLCILSIVDKVNLFSELNSSVQSISRYMNFSHSLCIGEFILLRIIFDSLVVSTIVLLGWLIYSLFYNAIVVFVGMGVLLLAEYGLSLLAVTSQYRCLGVLNLFAQIRNDSLFSNYENIRIMERAMDPLYVSILLLFILIFLMCIISFAEGQLSYPKEIRKRTFVFAQLRRKNFPIYSEITAEIYKLIVGQKGWIIIVLFIIFVLGSNNNNAITRTSAQKMYYDFVTKYEGTPTTESDNEIEKLKGVIKEVNDRCGLIIAQYQEGKVGEDEYFAAVFEVKSYEDERIFCDMIDDQKAYIDELSDKGIDAWYINRYAFSHLFRISSVINNIIVVLCACLLSFISWSQEKQAGMNLLLRSCMNGKRKLRRRKICTVSGMALILYIVYTVNDYYMQIKLYGLSGLNAPIQSVTRFKEYPFPISILHYLVCKHMIMILTIVGIVLIVYRIEKSIQMKRYGRSTWN